MCCWGQTCGTSGPIASGTQTKSNKENSIREGTFRLRFHNSARAACAVQYMMMMMMMINARAKWSFFESIYVLITTLDVLLILPIWYFPGDFQQPKQSSYHVQRTMKKKKNVYLHGLKICTKIKRGWKWHGYYELILCIVFNFTPELCKLKKTKQLPAFKRFLVFRDKMVYYKDEYFN